MAELILGVDGGGSKTRALLAAADGRIVGVGVAGSSNHHGVGIEGAVDAVAGAVAAAGAAAGLGPRPAASAACFGLAGIDRPVDARHLTTALAARAIAPRFEVVNDVELILAAGGGERWGVALIGGTGSIGYGRGRDGRTARAGGWGYILGDEGSGYSIAIQALRLATQTADGRADAHAILGAVLEHWHLEEPSQLLTTIYRPDITIAEIAGIAGRVLPLAGAGDEFAQLLVDRAAEALAALVDAVADGLALERPPLAMAGGVLVGSPRMQAAVLRHVARPVGPHRVVSDPALGALAIARGLVDGSSTAQAPPTRRPPT